MIEKPQNPYPKKVSNNYTPSGQLPNQRHIDWQEGADAMEAYFLPRIEELKEEIQRAGNIFKELSDREDFVAKVEDRIIRRE